MKIKKQPRKTKRRGGTAAITALTFWVLLRWLDKKDLYSDVETPHLLERLSIPVFSSENDPPVESKIGYAGPGPKNFPFMRKESQS